MFFVFKFELFKCLVTFRFSFIKISLNLGSQCHLILNMFNSALSSSATEVINSPKIKLIIILNMLLIKYWINKSADLLALDLLQLLGDLLAKSESFLLLPQFFVNHGHVLVRAFLLGFFSHSKDFSEFFSYFFDEAGTVTHQSTFDRVDEGASFFVEAVATASSI